MVEQTIIDMHLCPRCNKIHIEEYTLVCSECEPELNVDLAIHVIHHAMEALRLGDRKYLTKQKELLVAEMEALTMIVKSLC